MLLSQVPEFKNMKALGITASCKASRYADRVTITARLSDVYGEISEFPGCCGIAVLHDIDCDRSVFDALLRDCENICGQEGFGQMVYTTVAHQRALRVALIKNGWKPSPKFRNPKTENYVTMYTKTLTKQKRGL